MRRRPPSASAPRLQIAGPQPGLHMGERDAEIERSERRNQNGRGIALGDHDVGAMLDDHALHLREHGAGPRRQRLCS